MVPSLANQLCASQTKTKQKSACREIGGGKLTFPPSFPELACAQLQTIFQHAYPNGGTNGQPLAESFVACSRNGHPRKSPGVLKSRDQYETKENHLIS